MLRRGCILLLAAGGAGGFQCQTKVGRGVAVWASTAPHAEPIPESSSVKLTVPVSGAVTRSAFKRAAAELAKLRPIPGWRKKDAAKIPAGVVASAVGPHVVKAKAIEALSETEVHSAISSLGIEAVGQARLMSTPAELVAAYAPGEPFDLIVKVDVWPKAAWTGSYEGLEIEVEKVKAEDDVRAKAMEALRERYIDLADSSEPAKMGDQLTVDMRGYVRDEAGEKAGELPVQGPVGGEGLELVLDSGKFLPGICEALVGTVAGETRVVPIDFPEAARFRDKQPLAGVEAIFEVDVKAVKTRTKPELNDDFAAKIRPGLTLEALEKEVEYTVGSTEDEKTKDKVHAALELALVEKIDVPLPETAVVESARQKFAVMLSDMRTNGTPDEEIKQMISKDGFEKYLKVVRPKVESELKARLVVEAIARDEHIQPDQTAIDEQLELVKRQYAQQEEKESSGHAFNEERAREKIISELVRIKVLDKVASTAKINYVEPPSQPAVA
ncbi:hypothetical protein CTAYLR_004381 [Chrysophaeum taylorii]|uniref:peptidylprolyl isomerase n=1 Tax=Chrysophaeum taylorii TaxID=2483200 RepID=A0AAD7UMH6_9STRA|nr:hypothetical protein CTAYLR_004381 [Chrysophaeum taylorii]